MRWLSDRVAVWIGVHTGMVGRYASLKLMYDPGFATRFWVKPREVSLPAGSGSPREGSIPFYPAKFAQG
jgi:hypothetical protein